MANDFNTWVLIHIDEAENEAPLIVAHALDYDIVTQGPSIPEAMIAVCEAVRMFVREADDVHVRAPQDDWAILHRTLDGSPVSPDVIAAIDPWSIVSAAFYVWGDQTLFNIAGTAFVRLQDTNNEEVEETDETPEGTLLS